MQLAMSAEEISEIKESCTALILQFAYLADTGEYRKLSELFIENARFMRGGEVHQGREAIHSAVEAMLQNDRENPRQPGWRVRHFCSNIQLSVPGPEQAAASAYYTIYRYQGESREGPVPVCGPALIGDYADTFCLSPSGWLFKTREVRPAFFVPGA